jgi:hypothetical protein
MAMTAEFSLTYDDYVDITERTLRRFMRRHLARALSAMVSGLLAGLVAYYFVRVPAEDKFTLVLGVFAAVSVLEYTTRPMRERWRIGRLLRRQVGPGTLHCIVTMDDIGVTFAQDNGTFSLPWSKVAEVSDTVDGVEIVSKAGGVSVVRARAFATPQAKAEFAAYASARVASAR